MAKFGPFFFYSDKHILTNKIAEFVFCVGDRTFESAWVVSSRLSLVILKRNKLLAIEKWLLFSFEMSKAGSSALTEYQQ